jgi:hypothetical protein
MALDDPQLRSAHRRRRRDPSRYKGNLDPCEPEQLHGKTVLNVEALELEGLSCRSPTDVHPGVRHDAIDIKDDDPDLSGSILGDHPPDSPALTAKDVIAHVRALRIARTSSTRSSRRSSESMFDPSDGALSGVG